MQTRAAEREDILGKAALLGTWPAAVKSPCLKTPDEPASFLLAYHLLRTTLSENPEEVSRDCALKLGQHISSRL